MIAKVEHLYIHIPFCKSICTYCDFVRFVANNSCIDLYIRKIIDEISYKYKTHQFKTIYIGGGTPNYLNKKNLTLLLSTLKKYLKNKYEFTIECNPEFLTKEQAIILKQNKVNRVSIGAQTTNNNILQKFQRRHTIKNIQEAIQNLRGVDIFNISIDFIYGFNELKDCDIFSATKFIGDWKIPHVSWYALELKSGSLLNKQNYQLNNALVEHQLSLIIKSMNKIYLNRYEVSNWSLSPSYESQHNKAYWLTKNWAAIGLGAFGFEKMVYYENIGNLNNWKPKKIKYKKQDYYFQIMLMGLRLIQGIDLKNPHYLQAYKFYKNKLKHVHIKNNHLIVDNVNLLDNTLEELV